MIGDLPALLRRYAKSSRELNAASEIEQLRLERAIATDEIVRQASEIERLRSALRYIASPTMALPVDRDALDFVEVDAKELDVQVALGMCIWMVRVALGESD